MRHILDSFGDPVVNSIVNSIMEPIEEPVVDPMREQAYAARFGREVLGPAVCGFTLWLLDRIRSDRTEKIFFLGRDGWLLLQAYRLLAGPEDPPAFYLQVSRRSLRVPLYSRPMSYEEAVSRAGFPVSVTLACFLDGLGMDPAACGPLADRYGIGAEEQISRDRLYKDPRFRGLYEELADRIRRAALQERQSLRAYLKQFNFRGSWAVADIGWGGTLQRDLWELLGDIPGLCPPAGCYLGLSSRADAVLGPAGLSAAGYLFDSRRESGRSPVFREPQRLYVGLLETLLAEQTGSVRDYISDGRGGVVPRRYPFEGGKGRGPAADAQAAALEQIRDYGTGRSMPPPDALSGRALVRAAMYPSGRMVRAFGSCLFLDSGSTAPLARPAGRLTCLFHPRILVRDFRASRWKAGFLRALLGFSAPCTLLLAAAEWAETAGERCMSAAGTACLLAGLARNDIRSRFSGSFLGLLWAFLLPLITILVFWYVFQRGFRNPDVGGAPILVCLPAGLPQSGCRRSALYPLVHGRLCPMDISDGYSDHRDPGIYRLRLPGQADPLPDPPAAPGQDPVRLSGPSLLSVFSDLYGMDLPLSLFGRLVRPSILQCLYRGPWLGLRTDPVCLPCLFPGYRRGRQYPGPDRFLDHPHIME